MLSIYKRALYVTALYKQVNFNTAIHQSKWRSECVCFQMHVLSPEKLPYFNSDPSILVDKGAHYTYYYNVREQLYDNDPFTSANDSLQTIDVENTADIRDVPIDVRGCRFPDEQPASAGPVRTAYGISSCFTELRVEIELARCNCTMPSPEAMQCMDNGLQTYLTHR